MPRMSNPACALAMCRAEYQGTGNGWVTGKGGAAYYEFGVYGEVMRMIRAGKSNEEITARFPKWKGMTLEVCRKIANGTSANFSVRSGTVSLVGRRQSKQYEGYAEKQEEALRLLRDSVMTDRAISKRVGVSPSTIKRWKESGL